MNNFIYSLGCQKIIQKLLLEVNNVIGLLYVYTDTKVTQSIEL